MAVGELLLSAFLSVLFDRLASQELLDFASGEGVSSKLKMWEETLVMIQAVLGDAEEKQLTDRAVNLWLDNLRDLAYDVEDILDELDYEALRRKVVAKHQTITSKILNLIPASFTGLSFNVSMGSKIKNITSRLEHLFKQRIDLGLQMVSKGTSTVPPQRPPSTSVPTESAVYGREKDKANILKMVLRNETTIVNFQVIPIVGMGGIGKTTLAREVYNDRAVDDFKFDIKAWVCVSDQLDVLNISRALLESIISSPCNLKALSEVQLQLKKAIEGRKFLVVLDDVWNKNYGLWDVLKSPFMAGALGSKIIVTTRETDVASIIGPFEHYDLKFLSDDDCWAVFMMHAFQNRDIGVKQSLELIRAKVVQKCRGLPLAARTLGGLVRSKQNYDMWEDILNNKIWDLPEESGILPVLRLSYHHLPSHLKRCFAFCAIFPKDYEFEEKELVLLWMAEGVIQPSKNNKQLEDLGSEYFHDLYSRSIFQQSIGNSSKFVMHDLVHDLAQLISGDTSFRLEEANKQLIRFKRARHSSFICCKHKDESKFKVFHQVQSLRTFLPVLMGCTSSIHYITHMVISDLLPQFKRLRVLSLKRYYITNLPESIGCLIHLRYIDLSSTMIKSLPESTSSLFNLQTMLLRDCSRLVKLPSNMMNLINLRHLDITGASLLNEMPRGMKELKYLHKLSNFIVSKDSGSSLKDLKNLKFLHGELCISKLENVTRSHDIREPLLSDKKDLEVLSLQWSRSNDSRNVEVEKDVLHMLQPHRNLKELTVKYYGGTRFPWWVGDSSFSNMVVLKLENCERCTSLPSLGMLGLLRDLTIEGMKHLRSIGLEIYGKDNSKPFQWLETLCFRDLQEWEYWDPMKENYEYVEIFPRLRELSIVDCPKLVGKLPDRLLSLETLIIRESAQLVVSFLSYPMLCKLEIDECKAMMCSSPIESKLLRSISLSNISEFQSWSSNGFQGVECLRLTDCEELISLWRLEFYLEKSFPGMHSFTSLKELSIESCFGLILFPQANFLPNLSSLQIKDCYALRSLPEGMKQHNLRLESLQVEGCHSLVSLLRGTIPSSLKKLIVRDCNKLLCLVDDRHEVHPSLTSSSMIRHEVHPSLTSSSMIRHEVHPSLTSSSMMHNENNTKKSLLEYLLITECESLMCILSGGQLPMTLKHITIRNCSELTTLSSRSQVPLALEYIHIVGCSKLESIAQRSYGNSSLKYVSFIDCKNLKCIPEGLHNLTCLEDVVIMNCPSLVSFLGRGFPNTILRVTIQECEKLQFLPNSLHSLNFLQELSILDCPSIVSFPEEGFPTNITSLLIEGHNIYKAFIEWGLHKFTSLKSLCIIGCPDAVCFPQEDMGIVLPTSLTDLNIESFPKLKYLSSMSFESLTSLESLTIWGCPKLKSFPKEGLPSSLLHLYIRACPSLKTHCKRDEGREWSKIANIPYVMIDGNFIYDSDEEGYKFVDDSDDNNSNEEDDEFMYDSEEE